MIRRLKIIAFAISLAGFAVMAGVYDLGFERWPPRTTLADGRSIPLDATDVQACFRARALALLGDAASNNTWQACHQRLMAYRALNAFEVRSTVVVAGGVLGLLALFGFAICLRIERPSFKVTRGSRRLTGAAGLRAFARASKRECRIHGRGVELLPPVAISRDRETRHFLILGSVGGGKTQTMLNLILGAIARDDTVLVLDTKGDMTASLPGAPMLVAPHDRRSLVWDIASDCRIRQDARELAARFIPASPDPMWSEAAREIFVACVVHLQATKNCLWNWADLDAAVNSDTGTLARFAKDHNPNAARILAQPDSKTTMSILTTFQTHMRTVSVLAEAWPDNLYRRFSIRDWLIHAPKRTPLILQHDPGYPELSRIWIGSMLSLLASAVGSPSFTESNERRVWLFLDEFPQLPAIRNFPIFLELGRSKGVAVVIGAQDTAQIRTVYGADQTKAWFGMTGTKIITRINASESAEDISRIIGEQEIERPNRSVTRASGRSSVTESLSRETRRVVTPSELATGLEPTDYGVRVLFLGLGRDIYELELPYITLPQRRPPTLPADWTQTPPPPPPNGTNGEAPPAPSPVRLTQDVANLNSADTALIMVASISARGSAKAALAYYDHLCRDDYYMRGGEPPGRWAGEGAERLSLRGPVTQTEFEATLTGVDPKTGDRLVQHGGRGRAHSAGWDMTFSAPKSVSVLWALSAEPERQAIERAHQSAVLTATAHLERTAAWARRGQAGSMREQTAGLLMAQFDHHTSRESDPQLHTHSFIFNLAPRGDGSWGAIVSRELYKAQKDAGAMYRRELAGELERLGYRLDRQKDGFRIAAIPRDIERAFSKRRQAIEEAARTHGYKTPKGMELAALRTRRAKTEAKLDGLFKTWQAEARALGFELNRDRYHTRPTTAATERSHLVTTAGRFDASAYSAPMSARAATAQQTAAQLGSQLGHLLRSLDQPAGMPGIKVRLRQSDRERERE